MLSINPLTMSSPKLPITITVLVVALNQPQRACQQRRVERGERVVITANALNVRSGPGSSNPVQFSLASGTIVDVLAKANGWTQIRDTQGRIGWVSSQFTVAIQ